MDEVWNSNVKSFNEKLKEAGELYWGTRMNDAFLIDPDILREYKTITELDILTFVDQAPSLIPMSKIYTDIVKETQDLITDHVKHVYLQHGFRDGVFMRPSCSIIYNEKLKVAYLVGLTEYRSRECMDNASLTLYMFKDMGYKISIKMTDNIIYCNAFTQRERLIMLFKSTYVFLAKLRGGYLDMNDEELVKDVREYMILLELKGELPNYKINRSFLFETASEHTDMPEK